jgi:5,10-methylenetetrahydrofolate reductase
MLQSAAIGVGQKAPLWTEVDVGMKTLKDVLHSSEFAVTAELALTPQQNVHDVLAAARVLADVADAVQIPDHRNARPHISPVAIGAHLRADGIDPVVRMNCRDRNRIAVHSELLAARSFGISNLLLARGGDLPEDHRPPTTGVYDLSTIDLVRIAADDGRNGEAHDFFIGTVATAFNPKDDWTPEKLQAKADAGAQFIQLQLCMNTDVLKSYVSHLVDARLTWRFQVLANIAVLTSVDDARAMRRSNPGSIIPSTLVARLEQADDQVAEGISIAAEMIQELRDVPGIAGVNLQTTDDSALLATAIRDSGVRRND